MREPHPHKKGDTSAYRNIGRYSDAEKAETGGQQHAPVQAFAL
jgi:hypothetical protein